MPGSGSIANDKRLHEITPVILAGGKGMRLRPLTSEKSPKPFLKPFSRFSLLQETALRTRGMDQPVVVTHELYGMQAAQELYALGFDERVICEPEGRSTAPAIALAALALARENRPMLVMPSDHYIEDDAIFRACVCEAAEKLAKGRPVILGVLPEGPQTRYGYITADQSGAVQRFVEKPDEARARALLAEENCYWNTGIFLIRPRCYLDFLRRFAPDVHASVYKSFRAATQTHSFLLANKNIYCRTRLCSVDHDIMENIIKTEPKGTANKAGTNEIGIRVLPLSTRWHDIGCWQSLLRVKLKTLAGQYYSEHDRTGTTA